MLSTETIRIENPRLYSIEIVDQLRTALSNGAKPQANEGRINFYDLATENRTYFIYVSPVSGDITLIATWAQKRSSAGTARNERDPLWRRIKAEFLGRLENLAWSRS